MPLGLALGDIALDAVEFAGVLGDQFRGAGLGRAQALLDLSAPDRIEPQFGEGCEAGRFLLLQARDRIVASRTRAEAFS